MPHGEPIALPSTWRGPELHVISGRVAKTRAQLASLRDTTPRVDGWLAAAAIVDAEMPLRDSEPEGHPVERCDGCGRCQHRKRVTARARKGAR